MTLKEFHLKLLLLGFEEVNVKHNKGLFWKYKNKSVRVYENTDGLLHLRSNSNHRELWFEPNSIKGRASMINFLSKQNDL